MSSIFFAQFLHEAKVYVYAIYVSNKLITERSSSLQFWLMALDGPSKWVQIYHSTCVVSAEMFNAVHRPWNF